MNILRRRGDGSYMIPEGEIPPAPFTDNVENGPWDSIDKIKSWFQNKRHRSSDDERVYLEWEQFANNFPRNDHNLAHFDWVEEHKDNRMKYYVPFAAQFATSECGTYHDASRDYLETGITLNKYVLPKAKTMPSVQQCRSVKKGSARDVDPRQFADGSKVQRPSNSVETAVPSAKLKSIKDLSAKESKLHKRKATTTAEPSIIRKKNIPIPNKKCNSLLKTVNFVHGLELSCITDDTGETIDLENELNQPKRRKRQIIL